MADQMYAEEKGGPPPEVHPGDVEVGDTIIGKDELLLAKLGYKQEFYRKLGFFGTASVYLLHL